MKILVYIHSLSTGGAERAASRLANYWVEHGIEVHVVTNTLCSDDSYQVDQRVRRSSLYSSTVSPSVLHGFFANIRRIVSLRKLLKECQPDIALGMMTTANITLGISSFSIRDLITLGSERIHPPQLPIGRIWGFLRWWIYGRLSCIVTLTEETQEWALSATKCGKATVIPNACRWPIRNHEPIVEVPFELRRRRLLLAVGRFVPQKGFDDLITIYQRLCDQFSDWDLVIVGCGQLEDEIRQQVELANLTNRVHLVGWVGNLGDWYEEADVYVMTSRYEGFPNGLLEAMGYGLPVVSYDCQTGPRDIIRDGHDGFLVPNGDTFQFGESLSKLMENQTLRISMSRAAADVQSRFSMEKIGGSWLTLFSRLQKTS